MRLPIFLFLLLSPLLLIAQDTEIVTLQNEPVKLNNRNFNIIKVIDSRVDTTRIGVIQTGMGNRKTPAALKHGTSAEIQRFLKVALPPVTGADSVYLNILDLAISEQTYAMKEVSRLKFKYEVLLLKQGELYQVLSVADQIEKGGLDVTHQHERNIRESLKRTFTQLATVNLATVLNGAGKKVTLNRQKETAVYPISRAAQFQKGIYKNLEEFRNNNPSIRQEFEIRRKSKSARVWLGTAENKPYYLNDKKEPVPIKEEVWGFCDGEKIYIKVKNEYFELIPENGIFRFWGYRSVNEQTGYAVGGLIGGIPQKTIFQLDLETGQYFQL